MESGGSVWSFVQKAALVVGGLSTLVIIGYLSDKKESTQPQKKKNHRDARGDLIGKRPNHPDLYDENGSVANADLTNQLKKATKYFKEGNLDRAEELFTSCLQVAEKIESDAFTIGLINYQLSLVYRKKQDLIQCEEYMLKALHIVSEVVKDPTSYLPDHYEQIMDQYSDIMATLSEVYLDTERYEDSEDYLMQCFRFVEKKMEIIQSVEKRQEGESDRSRKLDKQYGILTDNLGKLRSRQRRFDEAEVAGRKAVEILMRSFGPMEDITFVAKLRWAGILNDEGKYEQAADVYDSLVRDAEPVLGKNHPKIAHYLHISGVQNFNTDGFPYAERALKKAYEMIKTYCDEVLVSKQIRAGYSADDLLRLQMEILVSLVNCFNDQRKEAETYFYKELVKEKLRLWKLSPPENLLSRYLKTTTAALIYDTANQLEDLKIYYVVTISAPLVRFHDRLPEMPHLVITFENPGNSSAPLVVERSFDGTRKLKDETFTVQSPSFTRTEEKFYDIQIELFSDSTKTRRLATHYTIVQSPIDTTTLKNTSDLQVKLYEANKLTKRTPTFL